MIKASKGYLAKNRVKIQHILELNASDYEGISSFFKPHFS